MPQYLVEIWNISVEPEAHLKTIVGERYSEMKIFAMSSGERSSGGQQDPFSEGDSSRLEIFGGITLGNGALSRFLRGNSFR